MEYGEGQRGFHVVPQEDRDRIHNSSLDTSIPYIYTFPYMRARPCTSLCVPRADLVVDQNDVPISRDTVTPRSKRRRREQKKL